MADRGQESLFVWLDRAFWAVWLAFPVYLWIVVNDVLGQADQLARYAPDQAACTAALPLIQNFSSLGKLMFWSFFVLNFAFYLALLGMAHSVVRSCARGQLFVAPLIRMLWWIAMTVMLFPVIDLALSNATLGLLVATGDMPVFVPELAFDVTVFGVGLLLLTIAVAMRQAMRLHHDAELTI